MKKLSLRSLLLAFALVGSVGVVQAQTPAGADRVDRKHPGRQTTLTDAPQRPSRHQVYVRYYVPTGSSIPQVVRREGQQVMTSSPVYVINNQDPLARSSGSTSSTLSRYSFLTFTGRR